ncbi:MAG: GGDEF domain-containing phosphodiesterase [Eubacteriales bacterium]
MKHTKHTKHQPTMFFILWGVTTIFLLILLWQQLSYSQMINYNGLIRGSTQKYVKEELYHMPDDELGAYIDELIYDVKTDNGLFNVTYNTSTYYQNLLSEVEVLWVSIKNEALLYRSGETTSEELYSLSQAHFEVADEMVLIMEYTASNSLLFLLIIYAMSILLTICSYYMLKRKNDRLLHNTIASDKLTGLLSRIGFEEVATKWLRNNPNDEYISLKFDIHDFRSINTSYGYAIGDQLLRDISEAIGKWNPNQCICARIDSDNFFVFAKNSKTFFDDFKTMLITSSDQLEFTHHYGSLIFSYGIYEVVDHNELINTIMDKTSISHKSAKKAHNNSAVLYNDQLVQGLKRESYYSEHLYQGILNQEFQMYLQPQLDLVTMRTVSAEALVRWKLPSGELVFPDSFIPLFESKGIMSKLDFYMLEQACIYLKQQFDLKHPPLRIGVNFSRVTLYEPTFYDTFLSIVERYDVPHACIEIEVVETALNEVDPAVIDKIAKLREIGFKVAMDDFGAGYSSLSFLSILPMQTIKLDRQFLVEVDRNPKMMIIITGIVNMAHSMGMRVLCEGVEHRHHVEFLQSIGCDYAQGYYFARPVPSNQFSLTLAQTE